MTRPGHALSVHAPIATTKGWRCMGDLIPGDRVFDLWGCPTRVIATSRIFRHRPVFAVDCAGDAVIADAEHVWPVIYEVGDPGFSLVTTRDLLQYGNTLLALTAGQRQRGALDRAFFTWRAGSRMKAIAAGVADTVCIQVADPTGIFRVGHSYMPTHNSEMVSRLADVDGSGQGW